MSAATLRRLVVAQLVREAIAGCPAPVRQQFDQVDVVVKESIDPVDLERGATADLRGYYYAAQDESEDGVCEDRLSVLPGAEEARPLIVIVSGNVEPTSEAVGETLMHELGHHLGFGELELTEGLGLK